MYQIDPDGALRLAAAIARQWIREQPHELPAVPSLPEQEGYRRMPERQRHQVRMMLLTDVEREFLPRQLARTG